MISTAFPIFKSSGSAASSLYGPIFPHVSMRESLEKLTNWVFRHSLEVAKFEAEHFSAFGLKWKKTVVPKSPSFVRNDNRWNAFRNYFQDAAKKKSSSLFPSLCDSFTPDLEELLSMSYNAKCREGKIILSIEGKKATLQRHFADLREQGKGIHYYIELLLDGEEWIIDPTWKQFAGKQVRDKIASYHNEFIFGDPYNKRLKREFPDILVIKRHELFSLLIALGNEAEQKEMEQNVHYWDKTIQQPSSVLPECIEEASTYTSKRPYYAIEKWKLFQTLTGNKSPNFEHFSRNAMSS